MADEKDKLEYSDVYTPVRDLGVDIVRSAASLPGALLGISDISQRGAEKVLGLPSTGDTLGSLWQKTGAPAALDKDLRAKYSPERVAKKAYADAEMKKGVIEGAKAYLEHPSLITGKIAESIPLMYGGGRIGAALKGAIESGAVRGAIGEGLIGAGSAAQQVVQETGGITPGQAGFSAASGLGTGLIAGAGGVLANRLGIPDPETWLAGAGTGRARGIVSRGVGGGISEGAQETLQSGQEQAWGNLAMGRPLGEGVPEAMVVGGLTGTAMGGGFGGFSGLSRPADTTVDRAVELSRRAEKAAKTGNEIPEVKRYAPAFSRADSEGVPPSTPSVASPVAQLAEQPAQLAQFAQQGAISAAAATAMGSGLAQQTAAQRMDQGPGESPLTLAEPSTMEGKTRRANLSATLAQAPSMPLQMAQQAVQKAAEDGTRAMVVPHPSGGFAIAPRSFLGLQEREQFAPLQKVGVAEHRGPGMPIATQEAAQHRADRLTLDTGVEHQVVPHPLSSTKFAVQPIESLDARPVEERQVAALQLERAKLRKSLLEEQKVADREAAWKKSQEAAMDRRRKNTAMWEEQEAQDTGYIPPTAKGLSDAAKFEKYQAGSMQAGVEGAVARDKANRQEEAAMMERRRKNTAMWEKIEAEEAGTPDSLAIDAAANTAAASIHNELPQPSQAQIEANNYKTGTLTSKEDPRLKGFTIKVETPRGSPRVAKDGSWLNVAPNHYGRIKGIEGEDGEALDVHLGQSPQNQVFVVSQNKPDGTFDEYKVMAFFDSASQAEQAYKAAYSPDWKGFGSIEKIGTMQDLKTWANGRKADLRAHALEGLSIDVDVEVAETGEQVKVRQDAREALVEARTKVRAYEQVLRCLHS